MYNCNNIIVLYNCNMYIFFLQTSRYEANEIAVLDPDTDEWQRKKVEV